MPAKPFTSHFGHLKRRIRRISILVVAFLSVLFLALPLYVEHQIKKKLELQIPASVLLTYDSISVNLLKASVEMNSISLSTKNGSSVKIPSLRISGIDILDYFFHDSIRTDLVWIDKPDINFKIKNDECKDRQSSFVAIKKMFFINELRITNGRLNIKDLETKRKKLRIKKLDVELFDITLNKLSLHQLLPLITSRSTIVFKNIWFPINPYENIEFDELTYDQGKLRVKDISIFTKYKIHELSRIIKEERDHIDVKIPEALIIAPHFQSINNKILFSAISLQLKNPRIQLYRDKTVRDDVSNKKLYGTILRELSFNFELDTLKIEKGFVSYKEQIEDAVTPEEIFFDHLSANSLNFSNTSEKIDIHITSSIMGQSKVVLDYSFSVLAGNDDFLISGQIMDFKASSINSFLRTNARSTAQGLLKELYFTSSGNSRSAHGDMKVKYDNFEFVILKKNRIGINKFLTAIGNLLISNDSKDLEKGYRFGKIETERDTTKSFFNYLWLQIKDGLISTVTGDGRKH